MEIIKQIDFQDFIDYLSDFGHIEFSLYKDKLMIFEFDSKHSQMDDDKNVRPLMKLDAYGVIIVESGELVVNIDYRPFCVGEKMTMYLSDKHIIQIVSVSDNFKCYIFLIFNDFAHDVLKDAQIEIGIVFPVSFFYNPVIQLEQEDFIVLYDNMGRLRNNIRRKDHIFWQKLVQNEITNLIFEMRNIVLLKFSNNVEKQKDTRSEKVIARFMQLLFEYSSTEREVSFYAEKLGVTPVYLSRAVKRVIGKPAIKLIQEMAISDAKLLLRKSNTTIQEASDAMNFPDRDTFSRYFKNIAGETPGEYKKKAKLNQ